MARQRRSPAVPRRLRGGGPGDRAGVAAVGRSREPDARPDRAQARGPRRRGRSPGGPRRGVVAVRSCDPGRRRRRGPRCRRSGPRGVRGRAVRGPGAGPDAELFLGRFVTKPPLAGARSPASLPSETPPSGRLEVQRRLGRPRGGACFLERFVTKPLPVGARSPTGPLRVFWRGLSPNLSPPGPGPRRVPSPRRLPPVGWRFSVGWGDAYLRGLSPDLSPSGPGPRRVPLCFLERFVTKPLPVGARSPTGPLSETPPSGRLEVQRRLTRPRRRASPPRRLPPVGWSFRVGSFPWEGARPAEAPIERSTGPGWRR
jgi:hypothetical protein